MTGFDLKNNHHWIIERLRRFYNFYKKTVENLKNVFK